MKTIIAGSRNIHDYFLVEEAIQESGFVITEVVSGGAKGVDSLGKKWESINNVPIISFPAHWHDVEGKPKSQIHIHSNKKPYWKLAGLKRNTEMVEYADALIAIWDGMSRGTKDTITKANKKGLKVYIKYV